MAAATVSETKRSKVDTEDDSARKQEEVQNTKKVVEYRTNIAVCETQMEELRYST